MNQFLVQDKVEKQISILRRFKSSKLVKSSLAFLWATLSIISMPIEASALQTTSILEKEGKVMDYEKLKIKSFKYWDLYLHENQCYLGLSVNSQVRKFLPYYKPYLRLFSADMYAQ